MNAGSSSTCDGAHASGDHHSEADLHVPLTQVQGDGLHKPPCIVHMGSHHVIMSRRRKIARLRSVPACNCKRNTSCLLTLATENCKAEVAVV